MRYIRIYKKTTSFYFPRSDEKRLKNELNKIPITRSFKIVWNIDRFTLKMALSKKMRDNILDIFKKEQKQIIRGHYGCLITGYGFGWK